MANTFSINSGSFTSSGVRSIFPLSILDISRTSLTRLRRWRLDTLILLKQSRIFSGEERLAWAMAAIPMIAFMGVRMSWDMEERKFVLAELATRAA